MRLADEKLFTCHALPSGGKSVIDVGLQRVSFNLD